MTSLYWPGESWLHRAPVGIKFSALFVISAVVVWYASAIVSAVVAVAAFAAVFAAGVPFRRIVRHVLPFVFFAGLLLAFQIAVGRWDAGIVAATRMLAVATVAIAITVTTRFTAIADAVERALRKCRVPPARVFRFSLAIGLALRSLDHLGVVANQVLDARRARGLHRNLRAFAVPTVVAAARFAHGVGEALEARGITGPERESQE